MSASNNQSPAPCLLSGTNYLLNPVLLLILFLCAMSAGYAHAQEALPPDKANVEDVKSSTSGKATPWTTACESLLGQTRHQIITELYSLLPADGKRIVLPPEKQNYTEDDVDLLMCEIDRSKIRFGHARPVYEGYVDDALRVIAEIEELHRKLGTVNNQLLEVDRQYDAIVKEHKKAQQRKALFEGRLERAAPKLAPAQATYTGERQEYKLEHHLWVSLRIRSIVEQLEENYLDDFLQEFKSDSMSSDDAIEQFNRNGLAYRLNNELDYKAVDDQDYPVDYHSDDYKQVMKRASETSTVTLPGSGKLEYKTFAVGVHGQHRFVLRFHDGKNPWETQVREIRSTKHYQAIAPHMVEKVIRRVSAINLNETLWAKFKDYIRSGVKLAGLQWTIEEATAFLLEYEEQNPAREKRLQQLKAALDELKKRRDAGEAKIRESNVRLDAIDAEKTPWEKLYVALKELDNELHQHLEDLAVSAPVANAGEDVSVMVNTPFALDASASQTHEYSQYHWRVSKVPDGANAVFSDHTSPTPSLTLDKGGIYVFELKVSDKHGSDSDTLSVEALEEKKGVIASLTGVNYISKSPAGHQWIEGVTDDRGAYAYFEGGKTSFAIGNIALGEFASLPFVAPSLLQGGADSPEAINLYRLLMTIDDDGDMTTGININSSLRERAGWSSPIEFTEGNFEADTQLSFQYLYDEPQLLLAADISKRYAPRQQTIFEVDSRLTRAIKGELNYSSRYNQKALKHSQKHRILLYWWEHNLANQMLVENTFYQHSIWQSEVNHDLIDRILNYSDSLISLGEIKKSTMDILKKADTRKNITYQMSLITGTAIDGCAASINFFDATGTLEQSTVDHELCGAMQSVVRPISDDTFRYSFLNELTETFLPAALPELAKASYMRNWIQVKKPSQTWRILKSRSVSMLSKKDLYTSLGAIVNDSISSASISSYNEELTSRLVAREWLDLAFRHALSRKAINRELGLPADNTVADQIEVIGRRLSSPSALCDAVRFWNHLYNCGDLYYNYDIEVTAKIIMRNLMKAIALFEETTEVIGGTYLNGNITAALPTEVLWISTEVAALMGQTPAAVATR